MEIKLLTTVFMTVFLAELGDKTQLATLLFASSPVSSLLGVGVAASLALVATTAIAVLVGAAAANFVEARHLSYVAGVGFIAVGIWTLWSA